MKLLLVCQKTKRYKIVVVIMIVAKSRTQVWIRGYVEISGTLEFEFLWLYRAVL